MPQIRFSRAQLTQAANLDNPAYQTPEGDLNRFGRRRERAVDDIVESGYSYQFDPETNTYKSFTGGSVPEETTEGPAAGVRHEKGFLRGIVPGAKKREEISRILSNASRMFPKGSLTKITPSTSTAVASPRKTPTTTPTGGALSTARVGPQGSTIPTTTVVPPKRPEVNTTTSTQAGAHAKTVVQSERPKSTGKSSGLLSLVGKNKEFMATLGKTFDVTPKNLQNPFSAGQTRNLAFEQGTFKPSTPAQEGIVVQDTSGDATKRFQNIGKAFKGMGQKYADSWYPVLTKNDYLSNLHEFANTPKLKEMLKPGSEFSNIIWDKFVANNPGARLSDVKTLNKFYDHTNRYLKVLSANDSALGGRVFGGEPLVGDAINSSRVIEDYKNSIQQHFSNIPNKKTAQLVSGLALSGYLDEFGTNPDKDLSSLNEIITTSLMDDTDKLLGGVGIAGELATTAGVVSRVIKPSSKVGAAITGAGILTSAIADMTRDYRREEGMKEAGFGPGYSFDIGRLKPVISSLAMLGTTSPKVFKGPGVLKKNLTKGPKLNAALTKLGITGARKHSIIAAKTMKGVAKSLFNKKETLATLNDAVKATATTLYGSKIIGDIKVLKNGIRDMELDIKETMKANPSFTAEEAEIYTINNNYDRYLNYTRSAISVLTAMSYAGAKGFKNRKLFKKPFGKPIDKTKAQAKPKTTKQATAQPKEKPAEQPAKQQAQATSIKPQKPKETAWVKVPPKPKTTPKVTKKPTNIRTPKVNLQTKTGSAKKGTVSGGGRRTLKKTDKSASGSLIKSKKTPKKAEIQFSEKNKRLLALGYKQQNKGLTPAETKELNSLKKSMRTKRQLGGNFQLPALRENNSMNAYWENLRKQKFFNTDAFKNLSTATTIIPKTDITRGVAKSTATPYKAIEPKPFSAVPQTPITNLDRRPRDYRTSEIPSTPLGGQQSTQIPVRPTGGTLGASPVPTGLGIKLNRGEDRMMVNVGRKKNGILSNILSMATSPGFVDAAANLLSYNVANKATKSFSPSFKLGSSVVAPKVAEEGIGKQARDEYKSEIRKIKPGVTSDSHLNLRATLATIGQKFSALNKLAAQDAQALSQQKSTNVQLSAQANAQNAQISSTNAQIVNAFRMHEAADKARVTQKRAENKMGLINKLSSMASSFGRANLMQKNFDTKLAMSKNAEQRESINRQLGTYQQRMNQDIQLNKGANREFYQGKINELRTNLANFDKLKFTPFIDSLRGYWGINK